MEGLSSTWILEYRSSGEDTAALEQSNSASNSKAIPGLLGSLGLDYAVSNFPESEFNHEITNIVATNPLAILYSIETWSFASFIDEAKLFFGWECYQHCPTPSWKSLPVKGRADDIHSWRIRRVQMIGMIDVDRVGLWNTGRVQHLSYNLFLIHFVLQIKMNDVNLWEID